MRIAIASDHAAVELRLEIAAWLVEQGHQIEDLGSDPGQRVDYPDYAAAVAGAVVQGGCDRGILLCGSGIGMSIAANKYAGIRAALVHDVTGARLAAEHNNANVLCMGARMTGWLVMHECIEVWLNTPFDERHRHRVNLIAQSEG